MNDDTLIEYKIVPIPEEFVPDPDLDALYRQAVAVAREFGWTVPSRQELEEQYRREMASKRQPDEM